MQEAHSIDPAMYQALVIRKGLEFYIKTGMPINKAYTPKAMMLTAERITGQKFPARGYAQAIEALTAFIENK